MLRLYRIKANVSPYSGKILEPKIEDEHRVTGFVRISSSEYATAQRTYLRDEVELVLSGRGKMVSFKAAPQENDNV